MYTVRECIPARSTATLKSPVEPTRMCRTTPHHTTPHALIFFASISPQVGDGDTFQAPSRSALILPD